MPVITTETGLQYEDLTIGSGKEAKLRGTFVEVHYTGWLQNEDGSMGEKFDSSKDRSDPLTFPLGMSMVIRGWDEGVSGMREGGIRRLIIPPHLAYGSDGIGTAIPPDSTLIFEVELLSI